MRSPPAFATLSGGALVCIGTALPWLSLFAGLQSYSGLVGVYGRVLFAGGMLAVFGGAALLVRGDRWLFMIVGALGFALTLFVSWLLLGLHATTRELSMHATLVARPGPGLFVGLGGALLVAATALRLPPSGSRAQALAALVDEDDGDVEDQVGGHFSGDHA